MSKVMNKTEQTAKSKYKIRNWSEYNQSLVKRGDLTIWIADDIAETWLYSGPNHWGSQYVYSDDCILFLLSLKTLFRLPYRQTQGFGSSLLRLIGYDLEVPSYTQLCRRAEGIDMPVSAPLANQPMHLIMDSTGLKLYGEGEWKVRKHGASKRRTWRKLHLAVDEQTGYIYACSLTKNEVGDASQVEKALDGIDCPIDRFSGDGAYDTYEIWTMLKERGIQGIIPPRRGAIQWVDENDELLDVDRNAILEQIWKAEDEEMGRAAWKKAAGYHRRSISENSMFRFKTIFGNKLYSRKFEKQQTEAYIKVHLLNKMTAIGTPVSIKVN